jgi:hypothetical protein
MTQMRIQLLIYSGEKDFLSRKIPFHIPQCFNTGHVHILPLTCFIIKISRWGQTKLRKLKDSIESPRLPSLQLIPISL